MKNKKALFITQAAVIAALYVVLVVIFNYISFGTIQFRVAEALTILPYFTPAAIPGLFIGCILANVIGGAVVWYIYHQIKNQTEKSSCDSNDSPWCVE